VPTTLGVVFRHTADTTQGQSGSPIWTVRGGRHILIGIVTSYDERPNQNGLLVHDGLVRRQLARWIDEDAAKVPKVEQRIGLKIPCRWICRLEVYDNDLRRVVGFGTGLLISDRHVLTAARVIHDFSGDRRRYSVRITPGYQFGREAFGSTIATKARVSPKFSPETKDGSADYGLLTLSRPLGSTVFSSIGNTALGYWGMSPTGFPLHRRTGVERRLMKRPSRVRLEGAPDITSCGSPSAPLWVSNADKSFTKPARSWTHRARRSGSKRGNADCLWALSPRFSPRTQG
jgi:hypothetical protein